ncbi:MAG: glycosyltransferase [Muribaculaceae bacterium]|jgi:glycosyltransferase involved in cell wall biosynthesis|nr:glycosyltransferase [Muribaculaceae bacterium]
MKIFIHVNALTGGGAEQVVALWATEFAKLNHDVTVIIRNDGRPITYVTSDDVRVIRIGPDKGNKVSKYICRLREARRLMKEMRPDVIIGVLNNATIEAYLASRGLGIPVINTEHNTFDRPASAKMPLSLKIKKFLINRLYSHVTVLTTADKDIAAKFLKRLSLMPNPLAFEPLSTPEIIDSKEKIVLAVGRIDVWHCKGFDLLIEAWAKSQHPGWRLKIMGGGHEQSFDYLKGIARRYGVENSIEFTGYTTKPLKDYQSASIFVLSSRYEGFGLVLIEAMSQGCACISADHKGRQREIQQDAGIIVDTENAEQIADAITLLVNDDKLRRELQEKAVERSKEYLPHKIAARWDAIFREVIK